MKVTLATSPLNRSAIVLLALLELVAANFAASLPAEEPHDLALQGRGLTEAEVEQLETSLQEHPEDLATRARLLGFYLMQDSEESRAARARHVLWTVRNHPDSALAGSPYCQLHLGIDADFDQLEAAWSEAVERHADQPRVLSNAANFFLLFDLARAKESLQKAQSLEPGNPEWSAQLGHLYSLGMQRLSGEARRQAASDSLEQWEKALDATGPEERFYLREDIATMAFEAGNLEKARIHAEQLLAEARQREIDWNTGNAVHHGNLVLGRLALASGDLDEAEQRLLAAGRTPGSPQLNSFGPNMTLAKELLERGASGVVLEYLELCGDFWAPRDQRLDTWSAAVEAGEMPDFGANLSY